MGEMSPNPTDDITRIERSGLLAQAVEAFARGDDYFREVLDALPAAIYITDADGLITYYNEAATALWGTRPKLGTSQWCGSWKLFWPDGRPLPHEECPMALALREKRMVRGMEAVAERPDGSRVAFIPYPTLLYDASGELTGAVNMLVDITERKRAEAHARQLASIVAFSDDAIISKDLNGVIVSWNCGAQRVFGYTAEEMIGRPVNVLIPPERENEDLRILARIRRGERIDHYETVRLRKDGSLVDISLTVSPIRDSAGEVIGASKVARDITERRRAVLQAAEMEERLRLATEAADIGWWDVEEGHGRLSWPPRVKAMFGISADAPVSMDDFYNGLHPDDRDRVAAAYAGAADPARRELYDVEYRTIGKEDGILRWVAAKGRGVFDETGRCKRVIGTAIDITERKLAQEEKLARREGGCRTAGAVHRGARARS